MDLNQNVNENVDTGTLRIHLTNESNGTPVQGAKISISYTGNPSQTIEEVSADDSGNSEELTLNAPPLEYSMEPSEEQPYAEYTIRGDSKCKDGGGRCTGRPDRHGCDSCTYTVRGISAENTGG